MPQEIADTIDELNPNWPVDQDDTVASLGRHCRVTKGALQGSFPNVVGVVNASGAELDILDGATISTTELNYLSDYDDTEGTIEERLSVLEAALA